MSDNIPQEVMTNILLRLRVSDLVRCRHVSKLWLSIIDDPHFISSQLQRSISTNCNAALYLQDRKSHILYWKQNYASGVNFFSDPIHREPSPVLLMGSCHGLVCFSLFNHPHDLVVLNPSTGERHTVSCSMQEEIAGDKLVAYGFGYDESSDDYKVVRILQTTADSYNCPYRAEINGVRLKGFFRTIPFPNAGLMSYLHKPIGVFVGGSIHWCIKNCTYNFLYEHVIHAVDLMSNSYHQLQCPDYIFGQTGFDSFNVGILDTRLSVCGVLTNSSKIGIWVMEEYGNPESWNRLCCIDCGCTPYAVTFLWSNFDKILLVLNWHMFVWCDPMKVADGTNFFGNMNWLYVSYEAMFCSESLVKIFPNQTADMKKDAYEKQLKRLADQEIAEDGHPDFLDLQSINALENEDYSEPHNSDEEFYVDNEFSDSEF